MNRRDFLKSTAAAAAFGAMEGLGLNDLLAAAPKKTAANDEQITRRPYKNTTFTLPLLGFGMMRLPIGRGGRINEKLATAMVERAMDAGLNYFDTAFMYHRGDSERFIGRILSRYHRGAYILTDKLPVWQLNSQSDMEKTFAEQLRRTKAGYFDFCFLHWLNEGNWDHAKNLKAYEFLKKKQQQGLIRKVGFSYHGEARMLDVIAGSYDWDLAQVQMNFRDWESGSRDLYEVLTRRHIPISVMGPLSGGSLASLSSKAEAVLRKADPNASNASWMFRFIGSLPNVQVVLSGMSTMEQLEDNIRTFTNFKPLTDAERDVLRQAARASNWKRTGTSNCTTCRYCLPCPGGVLIPDIFKHYNRYKENGDIERFRKDYQALPEHARAAACVDCKVCLKKCPQKIEIPTHLKRIAAEVKTLG